MWSAKCTSLCERQRWRRGRRRCPTRLPWPFPVCRLLGHRFRQSVRNAGDLNHFGDVVNANNVRAVEDGSRNRGGGAPDALLGESGFPIAGKRCAQKALAGSADKQRIAKLRELRKLFE